MRARRASARRRAALALALLLPALAWFSVLRPRTYPARAAGERVLRLAGADGLPPAPPFGAVQLVVSRYADDLAWLGGVAALLNASVRVYCKSDGGGGGEAATRPPPPPLATCDVLLPNVGNEGHSYLSHVVDRYESLADITVFLPDTLFDDPTARPHPPA